MNIFLIAFALLMAAGDFVRPPLPDGFWHYRYIGWLLIALTRFTVFRKHLYFILTGKFVLIVNENFVHDLVKNIKYNWNDIEEIYDKNAYLYIKLYHPADYLKYIRNPFKKLWAKNLVKSADKTPFKINMDIVNVNPNVLLQVLDNYSMSAANTAIE